MLFFVFEFKVVGVCYWGGLRESFGYLVGVGEFRVFLFVWGGFVVGVEFLKVRIFFVENVSRGFLVIKTEEIRCLVYFLG